MEFKHEPISVCPYISSEKSRQAYRLESYVNPTEFDTYLESGWRRFANYYFRPDCPSCKKCIPIRVLVDEFQPSKSQRKLLRKNKDVTCLLREKTFSPEIFEIYKAHSKERFNQPSKIEEFYGVHYSDTCHAYQSEYYIEGKLVAVGFLDVGVKGLSSSYFVFDPEYSSYSLGRYSILKEMEFAQQLGKPYYYLGYWIEENKHMSYKNKYFPHECLNWNSKEWERVN